MQPTWKRIPGFPGYEASELGQIRSSHPRYKLRPVEVFLAELVGEKIEKRSAILRPWIEERHGRKAARVALRVDGLKVNHFVHRLVALAFHGEPPEGCTDCCHGNHNSLDNRAANLSWDSHRNNVLANFTDEWKERRAMIEEELAPWLADTQDHGATPF